MRLAIIISGSRRLHSAAHRQAIRTYLLEDLAWGVRKALRTHAVILHGKQKGADLIADEEGRNLGLDTWGVPYFRELDDAVKGFHPGGPKRNECVIDLACVLRDTGLYRVVMGAFPDTKSKGTHQAIRYAKTQGIDVDMRMQR